MPTPCRQSIGAKIVRRPVDKAPQTTKSVELQLFMTAYIGHINIIQPKMQAYTD